eukprot:NODE_469_length_8093_cov_0.306230.p2 type:complete len:345 gc:universal NODE_469_length_8093_cov_0.306230:6626-7660(+)
MSVEHLETNLYEQQLMNQELQKYINRLKHQVSLNSQVQHDEVQIVENKPSQIIIEKVASRSSSSCTNNENLQKQNLELMQLLQDARDEIDELRQRPWKEEEQEFESFGILQSVTLSTPKKRKPLEWDSKLNLKRSDKIEFTAKAQIGQAGIVKRRLNQYETKSAVNLQANCFTNSQPLKINLDPMEELDLLMNKLRTKIPDSYIPKKLSVPSENLHHLNQILTILESKNNSSLSSFEFNHSHFAYHIMTGGYINCFRNFKKPLNHVYCWIQPMTWQLFLSFTEPGLESKSITYTYQVDPYKTYYSLLSCPINEGVPVILTSSKSSGNRQLLILKPLCAPEYHVW